jgi:hypothetical protein
VLRMLLNAWVRGLFPLTSSSVDPSKGKLLLLLLLPSTHVIPLQAERDPSMQLWASHSVIGITGRLWGHGEERQ